MHLLCASPGQQEEKSGVSCNIRRSNMDCAWDRWNIDSQDSSLMHTLNSTPRIQIPSIQAAPGVCCQQHIYPYRPEGESIGTVKYLWEPLQPTHVFPVNRSCQSIAGAISRRSPWFSPSMTPDELDVSEGRTTKSTAEPGNQLKMTEERKTGPPHDGSFPCFPSYFVPVTDEEQIFDGSRCVEYDHCGTYQFAHVTTTHDTLDIQHYRDRIHNWPLAPSSHGLPFLDTSHENQTLDWPGDEDTDPWDTTPYESTSTKSHSWTSVEDMSRFPILRTSDCSPFSSGIYTPDTTMTPSEIALSIIDESNNLFGLPYQHPPPQTEGGDIVAIPESSAPIPKHQNQRPRNNPKRQLRQRAKPGPNSQRSISKDAFLIDCKRRGMSYRDIKRLGGFEEAESTLRGRYRTLTKRKELRVRKPQWKEKDVKLLREAVMAYLKSSGTWTCSQLEEGSGSRLPKISWKKVGEYIWTHGGSYHFGNATCKKKWCEIQGISG